MARPLKYTTHEARVDYLCRRKKDRHTSAKDRHEPETRQRLKAEYETRYPEKKYKRPSLFERGMFVAWDGEGATIDGVHRYVLLKNDKGVQVSNPSGLSTIECFEALLSEQTAHAIHCCYGASYDMNMMLKGIALDIPKRLLLKLAQGEWITWHADRAKNLSYRLQYRQRKSLFVGRLVDNKDGSENGKMKFAAKMMLWDVLGFFQGSFLDTLAANFSAQELEQLGYAQIKAGKSKRSSFSADELDSFIIPYTELEVKALSVLMERLRQNMKKASVKVARWDGAGAIANFMLTQHKVRAYYGVLPDFVDNAARYAYGGGHIEAMMYGHYEGSVYHYDIRSAYPSIMVDLPCLAHGYWTQGETCINEIALLELSWNFPAMPFYPFFVRQINGAIFYEQRGRSWVYSYEYRIAQKTIPDFERYVTIHQVYNFYAGCNEKPFAWIAAIYQERLKMKEDGNAGEKVLKLGINSLYGKMVQTLGYKEGSLKLPAFFHLVYGGLITSGTRATLLEAAMGAPHDIIAFATDGLWSLSPLTLDIGDGLGQWEAERLDALTLVQSGVYWVHKSTTKPDESNCTLHSHACHVKQFYRGFDKDGLSEEMVLDAWARHKDHLMVNATRFIGLRLALQSPDFATLWCSWTMDDEAKRRLELSAKGSKRSDLHVKRKNPGNGLIRTKAMDGTVVSQPISLPWDSDYNEARRLFEYDHAMIETEYDLMEL